MELARQLLSPMIGLRDDPRFQGFLRQVIYSVFNMARMTSCQDGVLQYESLACFLFVVVNNQGTLGSSILPR